MSHEDAGMFQKKSQEEKGDHILSKPREWNWDEKTLLFEQGTLSFCPELWEEDTGFYPRGGEMAFLEGWAHESRWTAGWHHHWQHRAATSGTQVVWDSVAAATIFKPWGRDCQLMTWSIGCVITKARGTESVTGQPSSSEPKDQNKQPRGAQVVIGDATQNYPLESTSTTALTVSKPEA